LQKWKFLPSWMDFFKTHRFWRIAKEQIDLKKEGTNAVQTVFCFSYNSYQTTPWRDSISRLIALQAETLDHVARNIGWRRKIDNK
jgi:hypothetical protein